MEKNPETQQTLFHRLRADISAGLFRPGEWLRQIDLEDKYGVTRFDVRAALGKLQAVHFVEHVANRGYRVALQSTQQRSELTDTRLLLEIPAARLVAVKATESDIRQLSELAEVFDLALSTKTHNEIAEINDKFHTFFYNICGNGILAETIRELRTRVVPGDFGQWAPSGRSQLSSQDHKEMVLALSNRDLPVLERTIDRHLNRWRSPPWTDSLPHTNLDKEVDERSKRA